MVFKIQIQIQKLKNGFEKPKTINWFQALKNTNFILSIFINNLINNYYIILITSNCHKFPLKIF